MLEQLEVEPAATVGNCDGCAVRVDGDHRRVIGDEILALKRLEEPLLHGVFGGPAIAHAAADFRESRCRDAVDGVARRKMGLDLLVGPGSFELRDQVGGADDVLAQPADQVHGARIHERDRESSCSRLETI